MIKLFEVLVPIDGCSMSILMASPDEETAKAEVAKQLRASCGALTLGSRIGYHWEQGEMTTREVFSIRTS